MPDKFDLVDVVGAVNQAGVSWASALEASVMDSALAACGDRVPFVRSHKGLRLWLLTRDMITYTVVISEGEQPRVSLTVRAEIHDDHFCGWVVEEVRVQSALYRALARYFDHKTSTVLTCVNKVAETEVARIS